MGDDEAEKFDKIFKLFGDYSNNLESLVQILNIIGPDIKDKINDTLQNFSLSIIDRCQFLKAKAKYLSSKEPDGRFIKEDDLLEICKIIIELQLLKNNFT